MTRSIALEGGLVVYTGSVHLSNAMLGTADTGGGKRRNEE